MAKAAKVSGEAFGIKFTIDRSNLSDMSTMRMFGKIKRFYDNDSGEEMDALEFTNIVDDFAYSLFGEEQWDRIQKKLKSKCGDEPHFLKCIEFTFEAIKVASEKLNGDLKN